MQNKNDAAVRTLLAWLLLITAGCSANGHSVTLRVLRGAFAGQPHTCVPLGWNPVPVSGKHFYPGTSVEMQDPGAWIPALWIGLRDRNVTNAQLRADDEVLGALIRAGLVMPIRLGAYIRYRLTPSAVQYYYDDNKFGNNPAHLSYLCYSAIYPDKVLWTQDIRTEKTRTGQTVQAFRAEFEWTATEPPAWAKDRTIALHSVVLMPNTRRLLAKITHEDGGWIVSDIHTSSSRLPEVASGSAWPGENTLP